MITDIYINPLKGCYNDTASNANFHRIMVTLSNLPLQLSNSVKGNATLFPSEKSNDTDTNDTSCVLKTNCVDVS